MSLVLLFLGGETPFTIHDAAHGHLADNITLTAISVLTAQDAEHSHTADNVGILAVAQLVINDATHGAIGAGSPDVIYIDFKTAQKMSDGKYIKI